MLGSKDCQTCDSCEDTLRDLDFKLISIADKALYNTRYELNREVDWSLFSLLTFYKQVLTDICDDADCDCYTAVQCPTTVSTEEVNTGIQPAEVNHCICGCCPPLNVVCNVAPCVTGVCAPGCDSSVATQLTKENIIERIKILTA